MALIATIFEARLTHEALEVLTDAPVIRQRGSNPGKSIKAETTITNNVAALGPQAPNEHQSIIVQAVVSIDVRLVETNELIIKYASKYQAAFKVVTGNLESIGAAGVEAFAPYLAQTNWNAVRRADGTLANTGIANMRITVPEVNLNVASFTKVGAATKAKGVRGQAKTTRAKSKQLGK